MVVLGIDPGSRVTGYGVVEKNGHGLVHVDNGCIKPPGSKPLAERLVVIYQGLMEAIQKFQPQMIALEEVFFAKNVSSALKLGESRGVALLAASQAGVAIFEYSARAVKQALTGFGQADKNQIQKMVKAILKLPEVAEENASDALAVAICHLNTNHSLNPHPTPLPYRERVYAEGGRVRARRGRGVL